MADMRVTVTGGHFGQKAQSEKATEALSVFGAAPLGLLSSVQILPEAATENALQAGQRAGVFLSRGHGKPLKVHVMRTEAGSS